MKVRTLDWDCRKCEHIAMSDVKSSNLPGWNQRIFGIRTFFLDVLQVSTK